MLHKTRGIVFRFIKYGDTSIIVNIFTEVFGLQAYIVNGVRSKSAKSKIALYQPLTFLDMVVYHRANAKINRIKEVKCLQPFQSLILDVKKSTIGMFISEVLNKTVREESHTQEMFDFLLEALSSFDRQVQHYENFHLIFLLKLSKLLGFGPRSANEVVAGRPSDREIDRIIGECIGAGYDAVLNISNVQRRMILEFLLGFFSDHIENLGEFRSVKVLQEVMN
jgi:DNA repair protein RecO (recombination protein O)